jgi:hypothetical protein
VEDRRGDMGHGLVVAARFGDYVIMLRVLLLVIEAQGLRDARRNR